MNMTHGAGGRLVDLPTPDCWNLLKSAEIARAAWNGPRGVAVVPVNYSIAEGALWFRTNPYSALARESGGELVAVEVDSLDPANRSGWSVVVRGVAELVEAQEAPEHLADLRIWPAGVRNLFIRIEPVEVSGRRLLPAPEDNHISP
jgi:nitroimidazol reductase NimA-like FMN-containing flavoprotein (pyridoxamine 5'-phosphate oxidase superfamily)